MKQLFSGLKIGVNEDLYVKDPESSALGKKIVEKSILLIDEIGFESFTFKKLGVEIKSNESSIYRYFENKHKLLLYLTSWYWAWKEYQLVFATNNNEDAEQVLETAINILTRRVKKDSLTSHIDEVILNRVVVNEYSKSYLTKEVDKEYKDGYFEVYNRLILRLKKMILAVNNNYPFAAALASTVVEGGLHQHFLREHFPALTDCNENISPAEYFNFLVLSSLKYQKNG
ncbi:TetR/AcrR family transcriptional regulator [Antarcticibacterium flavum]|uniref:TetR/AcrR family transcriptional regulator n=1 Tax=Antarcticibacterium flavum TaxID=2058175 RepID=A0A5B7X8P5_9FLAO|nr:MULTISPECIES: TetR/AcrR family transcriptional regulator [Antarcticibacterium]MCM4160691.1 TetR family transcriptional regulator [Antarcticibacterium sp. W02-3]QCY71162.1 TetR/AcrR family transcriptional regulator [Antarcticibacterium flavum]